MTIRNVRRQHTVGQGFFHSSEITPEDKDAFLFVYDCGSKDKYAVARRREIDSYINIISKNRTIDILFISHTHADHVNGLPQLLDIKHGARVDTIVLPLINVVERVITFARAAAEDSTSAKSAFYRDFIVDPAAAMERFRPRQIIFIRRGGPDGSAPDGDEPPTRGPEGADLHGRIVDGLGPTWKLVGRGKVEEIEGADKDKSKARRYVLDDSGAISVRGSRFSWLLAPYVDPGIAAHQSKFLDELAKQCKIPRSQIKRWLNTAGNLLDLVTTKIKLLEAAYKAISGELNITSLCLYSGPARYNPPSIPTYAFGFFGCIYHKDRGIDKRIAWLGTGDAALKQVARRNAFVTHYGKLFDKVMTMTLPHHGSDHNFHPDLLSRVQAAVYIAAADHITTWHHPGSETVQSICSVPAVLQVVTSAPPSGAYEEVELG
ncbi:MAG: MBL fold metallo-hydrolase [Rhodospirillaceae bacterium]|nr:MBL fold metallo-hydrolase [Rhodospirillales bacterium]